ncbi:extracellular solute-binding protein [Paenibacillus wynnii]|uniref:Sugar ABC transporter substrate-binding protein n=1 Tax=Paenibacillus wynnii TaxID=268407 RepID=A0A098M9J8_9BACL|nr:extracellular solute-binding protein [Paenibacillus wynnii]KGE18207.1 sugar ABC transporter substrate-binding protein [Paenibacillus wynnii]
MKKQGIKKGLTAIMVGLLITTSLSACSSNNTTNSSSNNSEGSTNVAVNIDPLGKFPEPLEVSIGRSLDTNYKFNGTDTAEDNAYTRWLKEEYNIVVKHAWEASVTDYDQKVSLAISSNDLPDAMRVNETQLKQMIKADQLEDLTEVYKNVGAPRLKDIYESNPGLLENVTVDNKLYAFPETTLPSAPLTWIRKDWLDKLGLEAPKSLEDLEKIAKAFIDNKMGGKNTVGIVGTGQGGALYSTFLTSSDHYMNFSSLFFANGAYPGIWVKDKDGKAVYGSTLPETKQTLAMMREWYTKGILDKEVGLRKSGQEIAVSGEAGIFFGPWWTPYNLQDAIKNDPEANWRPYVAPLNAAGEFTSNQATGSNFIVVKKGYEHPEAVVKMLNVHVSEKIASYEGATKGKEMTGQEIPLFIIAGAGDQLDYTVNTLRDYLDGKIKLEDIDKVNYGFTNDLALHVKDIKIAPFDNYDIQHWDQVKDPGFFAHVYAHLNGGSTFVDADVKYLRSLATSKTKTMDARWTNLKKMEDETFLKIILGSSPLEDFDTFVQKWMEQGGDTITKEVNELQ